MQLRPTTPADSEQITEIDGTIDSPAYIHVERAGEGLEISWRMEERPARNRLILSNTMNDEVRFLLKQVAGGVEEGLALLAEHDRQVAGSLLARAEPERRVMNIVDLRVDSDFRRQGLGLALLYRTVQEARERGLRAVTARTLTNNVPAGRLLMKAGFDLGGLDTQHLSNHDLVKEAVSLFWYAALD